MGVRVLRGAAASENRRERLRKHAEAVFSDDKAQRWLTTPHAALRGKAPIDAVTLQEFREADDILGRIEHGVIG
jgi:uncharacterized protein (DUF2384 family)